MQNVEMHKCGSAETETALDVGIACNRGCAEDPSDEGTLLVEQC